MRNQDNNKQADGERQNPLEHAFPQFHDPRSRPHQERTPPGLHDSSARWKTVALVKSSTGGGADLF
jgi:hypothetical protein